MAAADRRSGWIITDEYVKDVLLHEAAYKGNVQLLEKLLEDESYKNCINTRIGILKKTPLRLATTAGHVNCMKVLLSHGANVDSPDMDAETPLFEAVEKFDVASCFLLLKAGANPDGNRGNLSSPLHIACQTGFTVGIQLLLEYGATITDSKDGVFQKHPLHMALAHNSMEGFALLLLHGVDVNEETPELLHHFVSRKFMKDASFINLWVEFGGSLWHRDDCGDLPTDVVLENPCHERLHQLMAKPLTLQSLCRITIRKCFDRHRLPTMKSLELPQTIMQFLLYQDIPLIRHIHLLINNTNYDENYKKKQYPNVIVNFITPKL